jgi:hypothetical protein
VRAVRAVFLPLPSARVDDRRVSQLCARLRRMLRKGYKSRTLDFPGWLDTPAKRLTDCFDCVEEVAADAGDYTQAYTPTVATGFLDLGTARRAFARSRAIPRARTRSRRSGARRASPVLRTLEEFALAIQLRPLALSSPGHLRVADKHTKHIVRAHHG